MSKAINSGSCGGGHLFVLATPDSPYPHLLGSKCRLCGLVCFPKKVLCHRCWDLTMECRFLSRQGVIQSFTVVHQPVTGFSAPYILALVQLPEGVTVFAPIMECRPGLDPLHTGDPVELVIQTIPGKEGGEATSIISFVPVIKTKNRERRV